MDRNSVFQKFCSLAPFAVMTQVVLRACIRDKFSEVFQQTRGGNTKKPFHSRTWRSQSPMWL